MINVTIKKQNGIIHLPDDFATLEEIEQTGFFNYTVKYSAEVFRAAQHNAFRVWIRVSNAPYAQRIPSALNTLNKQEMVNGLLLGGAQKRDASRSFEANYVLSLQSDISSRISNSKTRDISKASQKLKVANRGSITTSNTFGDRQQEVYSTKNTLALMSVNDLNPQNVAHPINQTHVFRDNEFSQKPNIYESRSLAENLLFTRQLDPSSIAVKTNSITSTKKQFDGLVSNNKTNKPTVDFQKSRFSADMLRASLIGQQKNQFDNQFFLAPSDKINVRAIKATRYVDIEETLRIPLSVIGDVFYLVFQLVDANNNEVETVSATVAHSRNVSIVTTPVIPPKISAISGGAYIGTNVLEITQLDPNATGVYVYKRVVPKDEALIDAKYILFSKIPLNFSDGPKRIVDQANSYNPTIYRVIAYNQFELKGSEYSSVVIQSQPAPIITKTSYRQFRTFVSMVYSILPNGIRLELNDIPAGPISLQLFRRNLTNNEKTKRVVGDSFLLNTLGNNASIVYNDLFVDKSKIYEYSVQLTYKDGTKKFSPTLVCVEFNPTTNNVINTVVSPPTVVRNGRNHDVTFNIENSVVEGKLDLVKTAMQRQGILGFFQDDIATNRQLLQNLIAHRIVRTNITTGEVEDFGIITNTSFSDTRYGLIKGVKSLQLNNEYRYAVYTHFRSAETLIDTFEKTVQDATNSNISYSFLPSKWMHPITLTLGNLVSARTLQTNYSKTDFTFGQIASIQTVTVSLVQNFPTISDGRCQKHGKNKVLIQWKLLGDILKIEHFIVVQEILGMRTIVGKVHNITDSNLIQFIDVIDNQEHAELVYNIIPVYFDYSRGPELKTQKVVV